MRHTTTRYPHGSGLIPDFKDLTMRLCGCTWGRSAGGSLNHYPWGSSSVSKANDNVGMRVSL